MWICFCFLLTLQSFKIKLAYDCNPACVYSPLWGFVAICNDALACGSASVHEVAEVVYDLFSVSFRLACPKNY